MKNAIRTINRIKNLGLVFSDYTRDGSLPFFRQVNLIYGMNRSGKTTLSRLFNALGGKTINGLSYQIEDGNSATYSENDTYPRQVKVFNEDYVRANLFLSKSRANRISLLLGPENKELATQIKKDTELLDGKRDDPEDLGKRLVLKQKSGELKATRKRRNSLFKEIAKSIGAAIGGGALRGYRQPEAKKDFTSLSDATGILDEDELDRQLTAVKQDPMKKVEVISSPSMGGGSTDEEFVKHIDHLVREAASLLSTTVESKLIQHLVDHSDISLWVEAGIRLHEEHDSNVCEYCRQAIPEKRVAELAQHFTEADRELKEQIDECIAGLTEARNAIENIRAPDPARLYEQYRSDYKEARSSFRSHRETFQQDLSTLIEKLKEKKQFPTEERPASVSPSLDPMLSAIGDLNEILASHNDKSDSFKASLEKSKKIVKRHYLSTIYDEASKLAEKQEILEKEVADLEEQIGKIEDRIAEHRRKISADHAVCTLLSNKLSQFLGHDELRFEPRAGEEDSSTADDQQYEAFDILRGGQPASHLSESEKTAIAFIYFVVHLQEEGFSVEDSVVVVDDPVSSFDSNSLYQAFSFLKNAVKDGGQVFILTHNFKFLKLLLNWRRYAQRETAYFMLKNSHENGERTAYLAKMDDELREYQTEYHYLFKMLREMRERQDDSLAEAYPVPNVARKVWESFLSFAVPNSDKMYKKMDVLKEGGHDEQILDAIYKFVNDQSHMTGDGFDPSLVPETRNVVDSMFEMMEEVAPRHYRILEEATR